MNLKEILTILIPVFVALAGSGGIVAYFTYKGGKPKSAAEAQKIEADVVVTFAEGWKTLAEKMESRVNKLEEDIGKLRESMDKQDEKYRLIIQEKDKEIYTLQKRVDFLETELKKYNNH